MPDYTLLVVPKGTVLDDAVEIETGLIPEKEDLPGAQIAKDLLCCVEWDCHALLSGAWVLDEIDPAPASPWSVLLWQYNGSSHVYCKARRAGEEGSAVFAGGEYDEGVLLHMSPNFAVNARELESILACTRLVAEINTGAPRVAEEAHW